MLNWIEYTPITYGEYEYSVQAQGFGWSIAAVSLIAIPFGAIHTFITAEGDTIHKKFLSSIKPTINDLEHKLFENRKSDSKSNSINGVNS
jgi:hypothetical protein